MTDQHSTTSRTVARIRSGSASEFLDTELEEFTPLGAKIAKPDTDAFRVGEEVELELLQRGTATLHQAIVVHSAVSCVIRFIQIPEPTDDRRKGNRWICPPNFLPTAVSPTPNLDNDFVKFQIKNFSSSGLELTTESDSGFLVRGMILRLTISLPLVGNATALAKIVRTSLSLDGGKDLMTLGAEFVDMEQHSRSLITNYLLQFSNLPTPETMLGGRANESRLFGFECSNVTRFSEFRTLIEDIPSFDDAASDLLARLTIVRSDSGAVGWASYKFSGPRQISAPARLNTISSQSTEISSLWASNDCPTEAVVSLISFLTNSCIDSQRTTIQIKRHNVPAWILYATGFEYDQANDLFVGEPVSSLLSPDVRVSFWNLVWEEPTSRLYETNALEIDGIAKRIYRIFKLLKPLTHVLFWLTNNLTILRKKK